VLGGGGGGGGRSAYTTRDQFLQSFVHNSFCLTVCLIILVFAVCLFEPLAPTNSVPGSHQDGSLRHILSVSQPAEDIRQHLELR
jgi:hypothetical protein